MSDMDAASVQAAYSRWAKVYDWVFGPPFTRARRRAIRRLELENGDLILEVGVGTGLSLPLFPAACRIVGVDFSRPMLDHAVERLRCMALAARDGDGPEAALVEGDGGKLPFADGTFDAALAPYVVSTAPEPVAILTEIRRVCRPGGRLVILNHFGASEAWLAALEKVVSPVSSRLLGFHAFFPMEPLFEAAGLKIESLERVPPLRYWQVVCCTANGPAPDA